MNSGETGLSQGNVAAYPEMDHRAELKSITLLALKLGFTAFGGPASHIAMLRQEAVERRHWIDDQDFLDLIGFTNVIPGPNSTEMVMHIGRQRAGRPGLIAAGLAFILPAASITLIFAWLYVEFGSTPGGTWLLYGIKPVIIGIVAHALIGLSRTAMTTIGAGLVAVAVAGLYLLGINELVLLFGGAVGMVALRRIKEIISASRAMAVGSPWSLAAIAGMAAPATQLVDYSNARLFFTFLKIGATLYGSGYVLIAFLRNDFVERYGWLTEQQLLDAVAVGQVTPALFSPPQPSWDMSLAASRAHSSQPSRFFCPRLSSSRSRIHSLQPFARAQRSASCSMGSMSPPSA